MRFSKFFRKGTPRSQLPTLLQKSLELELSNLSADQAEVIKDFIAHGEYGLAFEQICDALADNDRTPLSATKIYLEKAATIMGLTEIHRSIRA